MECLAMEEASNLRRRTKTRNSIVLGVCLSLIAIVAGGKLIPDVLAKRHEALWISESQSALRDISAPDQLYSALAQHPANKILQLLALANRETIDIDVAARSALDQAAPGGTSQTIEQTAQSYSDIEALRRALKASQTNAVTFKQTYLDLVAARQKELEREARSLNVSNATLARFMAMIKEQDARMIEVMSKLTTARAEYYGAYERCAALLSREFGRFKVTDGQLVFPFPSTAAEYNRAVGMSAAAGRRVAELEGERTSLRQEQLDRWKEFIGEK
ncbi:MAG: hypothetical protein C5B58_11170 [Acidobacteria bacterium]|nr:MAG: hypothetical protein C5B58_11170 [Acidobacteriota bacterium]